jgi:hypothetical protein
MNMETSVQLRVSISFHICHNKSDDYQFSYFILLLILRSISFLYSDNEKERSKDTVQKNKVVTFNLNITIIQNKEKSSIIKNVRYNG